MVQIVILGGSIVHNDRLCPTCTGIIVHLRETSIMLYVSWCISGMPYQRCRCYLLINCLWTSWLSSRWRLIAPVNCQTKFLQQRPFPWTSRFTTSCSSDDLGRCACHSACCSGSGVQVCHCHLIVTRHAAFLCCGLRSRVQRLQLFLFLWSQKLKLLMRGSVLLEGSVEPTLNLPNLPVVRIQSQIFSRKRWTGL